MPIILSSFKHARRTRIDSAPSLPPVWVFGNLKGEWVSGWAAVSGDSGIDSDWSDFGQFMQKKIVETPRGSSSNYLLSNPAT
jgi:hypothetical protein